MSGRIVTPLLAYSSLGMGLLILYISIFTLTLPHWYLPYLRLALAPLAVIFFWNFGYGPYKGPLRTSPPGLATIGLYGIMRILEHCVITLWDASPPRWVARTQSAGGSRMVISFPNTFRTRCTYAMDLLTSVRGSSWFADLEWNWVPRSLALQPSIPRAEFILSNIRAFLVEYLILDLSETILKSHPWDSKSNHSVTNLPLFQQVVFSICICAEIFLSMDMPYMLVSSVCVLCGSSPASWPPFFDSPFSSKSLKEFWSCRWHFTFRRVFERLSIPLLRFCMPGSDKHARLVNIMRSIIMFALSTVLHLIIMHRMISLEIHRTGQLGTPPFFDGSISKFFLLQPLGLFVESTLVVPLADWMFPTIREGCTQERQNHPTNGTSCSGHAKVSVEFTRHVQHAIDINTAARWKRDTLTRLYVWVFLIWTGRSWSDAWVRAGALDEGVKLAPISILRGLWDGRWI